MVCPHCRQVVSSNLVNCPHCGGALRGRGCLAVALMVLAVVGVGMFLIIGILAAILVPNFIRARAQGQFTACKSNLKNIGTALEMWSTDHSGRYPRSLSELTEGSAYLRVIPTCPAAASDTYSSTYQAGQNPDQYQVGCSGHHHEAVDAGPGYPQYNSTEGLLEK